MHARNRMCCQAIGLAALVVMWTVVFGAGLARAAQVEAKEDGVKVTDQLAASGAVLLTLKKGQALDAKERKGVLSS